MKEKVSILLYKVILAEDDEIRVHVFISIEIVGRAAGKG